MSASPPLAEQLRPTHMDFFVGQEHVHNKLRAFEAASRLPSILFVGPPGCGKSTLALLLARHKSEHVLRLSAPEAGIQHLRRHLQGIDILILDELHRFSKAQQDFFLPLIESGELTLLATTTENPSFSVTRQLLSRLHVLRLNPLGKNDLLCLAQRAVASQKSALPQDVLQLLVTASHGDARTLLNLIEHIMAMPQEQHSLEHIKNALPDILLRHDKVGDSHYELASALIKSIRGSEPDAALYYLGCLLESGEDPRFICRRLILSASEDIGLADSKALSLAVACQQAVEFVGMPEGFISLAHTVVYLALAAKSNSTYAAYRAVQQEIAASGVCAVPLHLRNASTKLQKEWGYGKGYKYPHNFADGWVAQDYLPEELKGHTFYTPRQNGEEPQHSRWWRQHTS